MRHRRRRGPFATAHRSLESYLAASARAFARLRPRRPRNVVFIVPVFAEHHRVYPRGPENPHGEDFVAVKVAQLEELFARNRRYRWKMVFVDDGDAEHRSGEHVRRRIRSLYRSAAARRRLEVRFLARMAPKIAPLSRKGGAVLAAMRALRLRPEDIVFYTDADLSSDLRLSGTMIAALERGADVAISSRWHPDSTVTERGIKERLSSWVYNGVVFAVLGLRYTDTQNGFKAFRRGSLGRILPRAKETGFTLDTELLLLAERSGMKVREIPIFWRDSSAETNVRLLRDTLPMVRSLFRQAARHGRR